MQRESALDNTHGSQNQPRLSPQQTRQVFIRVRDWPEKFCWAKELLQTRRLARILLGGCAARHAHGTHTPSTRKPHFSVPLLSCRLPTLHQYVYNNTPVSVNPLQLPVFLSLTPSFVVWQSKYVAYVHNIPRFGHSNDIALLTSPTKADDYKDGVRMVAVYSGFSL
jgi:hypothetical protein